MLCGTQKRDVPTCVTAIALTLHGAVIQSDTSCSEVVTRVIADYLSTAQVPELGSLVGGGSY